MRAPTPWLSRDFLIAGKVTLLAGDAWRAGVPLSLAWAAGLAAGRPVGAFAPRARFRSLVYSRVGFHEVHRRALTAAAERLGAAPSEVHEAVRLLRPHEAFALTDLKRDIVDHEPALLVLAPAEDLVKSAIHDGAVDRGSRVSASLTSSSLPRRLVAAIHALAKQHRLAVVLVHDVGSAEKFSEKVGKLSKTPTISTFHALTQASSIVFAIREDRDSAHHATLVQHRGYRGTRSPPSSIDLASSSPFGKLVWPTEISSNSCLTDSAQLSALRHDAERFWSKAPLEVADPPKPPAPSGPSAADLEFERLKRHLKRHSAHAKLRQAQKEDLAEA